MVSVIGPTLLRNTFSAHCFLYSFTASDGSDGTTAGHVVLPRSMMTHHGLRCKEARQARKKINYVKQHHTLHCWLPAKVMYPQSQPIVSLGWIAQWQIFIVE